MMTTVLLLMFIADAAAAVVGDAADADTAVVADAADANAAGILRIVSPKKKPFLCSLRSSSSSLSTIIIIDHQHHYQSSK